MKLLPMAFMMMMMIMMMMMMINISVLKASIPAGEEEAVARIRSALVLSACLPASTEFVGFSSRVARSEDCNRNFKHQTHQILST